MSEIFWADSAKKVFLEKAVQLLASNLRSIFCVLVRNIFFRDEQGDVQAVGATILSFFFDFAITNRTKNDGSLIGLVLSSFFFCVIRMVLNKSEYGLLHLSMQVFFLNDIFFFCIMYRGWRLLRISVWLFYTRWPSSISITVKAYL